MGDMVLILNQIPLEVLRGSLLPALDRSSLRSLALTCRRFLEIIANDSVLRRECFVNLTPLLEGELRYRALHFPRGSAGWGAFSHSAQALKAAPPWVNSVADVDRHLLSAEVLRAQVSFLRHVVRREEARALCQEPIPGLRAGLQGVSSVLQAATRYWTQGRACFMDGKVAAVQRSKCGGEFRALVDGNEGAQHHVHWHTIPLPSAAEEVLVGGAAMIRCTCPLHVKSGVLCKHIVASLLAASTLGSPPQRGIPKVTQEPWSPPSDDFTGTSACLTYNPLTSLSTF